MHINSTDGNPKLIPYNVRFRGCDPGTTEWECDSRYKAKIHRYRKVEDIPWTELSQNKNVPVRIIVWDGTGLPLDVLLISREHQRLLVGLHGAETRANVDLPKFQFATSFFWHRKETLLFLSDSSLLPTSRLGLAWMFGLPEYDLAMNYSLLINSYRIALGIKETVLVGHSGGGMAAILIGRRIPNSRAVSVNGQIAARLHEPWVKEAFFEEVTPSFPTMDKMFDHFAERLDLRVALKDRCEDATFTFFTHASDTASVSNYPHFPEFCKFFSLPETGGKTDQGDVLVLCDWEVPTNGSPHALPGTVIPFIERVLGETKDNDFLRAQADPRWYRLSDA